MPKALQTNLVNGRNAASVSASGELSVIITDMPAVEVGAPVGGATEAKQDTIIGHVDGIETVLGTIDADTGNIATHAATLAGAVTANKVQAEVTNTPNVAVTSTVLATGAATSAKQDTGNTSLATIAGAVAGTEVQVDVLTMPTTTVQATDLDIRNLVAATDGVTATVPTGGGSTILHAVIDIAAATTTQIVAADATKKIKVLSYFLFSAGTNTVTLKRGTTKVAGEFAMTVGMPLGLSGSIFAPVFATAANEALNITTSGTSQLSGHVTYILEA
jgi:hypothetical protein